MMEGNPLDNITNKSIAGGSINSDDHEKDFLLTEVKVLIADDLNESNSRVSKGLEIMKKGYEDFIDLDCTNESNKIIEFLEQDIEHKNAKAIPLQDTKELELDYDWFKYDKLVHHQEEKQKQLALVIKQEEIKGDNFDKQKYFSSGNTKKKKTILLLLNELRFQLNKECKERASILTKLWNAYFKETSQEFASKFKKKNKIIISLL